MDSGHWSNAMLGMNYLKKFSTESQLDEGTRIGMAQFFGNPDARNFIDDNGGLHGAMEALGAPSPQAPPAPAPAAPQPTFTSNNPQQMRGEAIADAGPAGIPTQPSSVPGAIPYKDETVANPRPGVEPVQGRDEYLASNPGAVTMPARPTVDFDNVHGARKAFMLAFLGLNKFGGALNGNNDTYADQFFGNTMKQRNAQNLYDQQAPTMARAAGDKAYGSYLENREKVTGIRNTESEINLRDRGMNPQQMQINAALRSLSEQAAQEWNSGKWANNPAGFQRAVMAKAQGLPADQVQQMLQTVTGAQPQAPKFTIQYSKEGGVPEGIIENATNRFIPESEISALDPSVQKMFTSAKSGYEQNKKDKVQQAYATGAARNDTRNVNVVDNTTGLKMPYTAEAARALIQANPKRYSMGLDEGVAKAKSGWALYGDVFDTANRLNAVLPTKPLSTVDAGKIAAAMTEYHGPIENALKSSVLSGLSPENAQLAANLLAMRDNSLALLGTLHIQASDTRAQAIFNAMPNAGDMQNPALMQAKMSNLYRMLHNLKQAMPGAPEQFGVEEHQEGGGAQAPNTFGQFMSQKPKKTK
jgi:hypothetical protein